MIPPRGFKNEVYPLRHRVNYSFGLSYATATQNTACATLIRHTNDVIAGTPGSIIVNPHNTGYVEDLGPAVCKMSIIDKLRLSLRFNLTETMKTDDLESLHFLWRPIFFSFGEKLLAADDDTGTTVEAILELTSDATFEDVVPLSATKLESVSSSAQDHPVSTVNIAEVFGDYNMTTNMEMEATAWDENLFQSALRRYTIKGALKSMVGRTRHVTLTMGKNPYKNFYLDKFVPKSVRRVMPYTFMAIQVHLPWQGDDDSSYASTGTTANSPHLGVKIICNYDEWNADHYQEMSGTAL